MRIFVIRHGQTTSDVEDRFGGDYDDHLTDLGVSQVKKMAGEMEGKGIEVIFASPKIRTDETSKILADKINAPIEVIEGFRERNNWGILTGMKREEAKEKYPGLAEEGHNVHHKIEGSEDYESFRKRVVEAFNEVAQKDHKTVAIVTHGGPIRRIFGDILKMEKNWKIDDCAWLETEYEGGKSSLIATSGITEN